MTEVRDWAIRILSADSLDDKLFSPEILTDNNPGPAYRFNEPVRPAGMAFSKRPKQEKLPPFHEHHQIDKRAICLHRFAGHELLAVEIMAQALLAFPEAPVSFRKGVIRTLKEEQYHVRLYKQRMEEMGLQFGDLPLYRHFWVHVPYLTSPLHYLSAMSLTFEMANLDFAPHYGKSFAKYGDEKSAQLMNKILSDEIRHVSFGYGMLKKLKEPEAGDFETYKKSLTHFLTPKRAKGFLFHEENRRAAGIPQDWIEEIKRS
ncbi:MAG TPA: DUF455 family protein [Chlamydiales bacterium]|nr:DUF455 family protein [Chlamydiales bacterium]